jgi:hypothetical protein
MAEDLIRYDILTQDALRGVIRKVLAEVSRTGLPGSHHFFIRFGTQAPGVRVSSRLLKRYPEEMSIVLQHQFRDLSVSEHAFEVSLSFDGVPERLLVPFAAVRGFHDPSVHFALQFEPGPAVAASEPAHQPAGDAPNAALAPPDQGEAGEPEEAEPSRAAQVVSLDSFRKKN